MSGEPKRKRQVFLTALLAPAAIIILAIIISVNVNDRFQSELLHRFNHDAEHVLRRATDRLDNYRDFLYGGRALVMSSQSVTPAEWKNFYNQQSIFARYPGISSVAYVKNVATADLPAFEQQMRTEEYFGSSYRLKAQSDRAYHGLVSMYVAQNDLTPIVGLDLFKQDDRNEIYREAEAKGSIIASPPIQLATGYRGYFSVLPVNVGDKLDGYVLISFRYEDLMKRLFADENFGYKVTDVTEAEPTELYASVAYDTRGYQQTSVIDVGGRQWQVTITKPIDKRPVGYLLPHAIVATSAVLALAIYLMPRTRYRKR